MTTSPSLIVMSTDVIVVHHSDTRPPATVAEPTYLPSNAVVVGAGAWAIAGSATELAPIIKSILARPNMLLSLFASRG